MQLEKNRRGRELRVVLSGELDHHNAAIIREEVDRELDGSVKLLTLDMSGITFMDSSGIGVVLGRYRRMSESGGEAQNGRHEHICGKDTQNGRRTGAAGKKIDQGGKLR